jgi:hypothetical protein
MRIQAALCGRVQQLRCQAHDAAMELDWCSTRVTHYGETQAHLAHCAYAHCTHAGSKCVWLYDGSMDGIFNLSGSEMFTHHFLANISDQIYQGGTPFHARAQQMLEQEGRVTDDAAQNMVSAPLLIEAFFGYVDLLTHLPKPCCDICGQKKNPLPPVNWRWVEEGGGYVRHEAWPHTPTVMEKHDCRVSPGTHQGSAIFTRAAASSPRPPVRRRQYLPRRGATGGIRTHDLNRLTALLYQLSYGCPSPTCSHTCPSPAVTSVASIPWASSSTAQAWRCSRRGWRSSRASHTQRGPPCQPPR